MYTKKTVNHCSDILGIPAPLIPDRPTEKSKLSPISQSEDISDNFIMATPKATRKHLPLSEILEPLFAEDSDNYCKFVRIGNHSLRMVEISSAVKYVSDGVGNDYKSWSPKTPVFIDSQTGSGKNHFIEQIYIPYIKDCNYVNNTNYQVLVFSNRIALNKQLKERIEKNEEVKVSSYQSFLQSVKNGVNLTRFKYIILDEFHFFTADAMFNPHTAVILNSVVNNFGEHAVRIYMSSTPDDCTKYILDYEHKIRNNTEYKQNEALSANEIQPIYYRFGRDYSFLDIWYYSEFGELYDIITNSIGLGEKWIVFINNRSQQKKFRQKLIGASNGKLSKRDIILLSADSKDIADYEQIIKNEKFNQKILITTSVIDNGINIKDSKVKNIILCSIEKDKCIQMIGRKRIINGEKVNLYMKIFNKDNIEKHISNLEKRKDTYHLYNLAYQYGINSENTNYETMNYQNQFKRKIHHGDISDYKNSLHFFYQVERIPGSDLFAPPVKPNDIALSLTSDILLPRYRRILRDMQKAGNGLCFLQTQLSWFEKTYDETHDLSIKEIKRGQELFYEYIEGLNGKIISREQQTKFKLEFFAKYNIAYGFRANDNKSRAKKEGYGKKIINEILYNMNAGTQIQSNDDGWKIISV